MNFFQKSGKKSLIAKQYRSSMPKWCRYNKLVYAQQNTTNKTLRSSNSVYDSGEALDSIDGQFMLWIFAKLMEW